MSKRGRERAEKAIENAVAAIFDEMLAQEPVTQEQRAEARVDILRGLRAMFPTWTELDAPSFDGGTDEDLDAWARRQVEPTIRATLAPMRSL